MARLEFLGSREATGKNVMDVLSLVGVTADPAVVGRWTPNERLMACDWAWRIHMRASDNLVRLRPRPSFIPAAWGGER